MVYAAVNFNLDSMSNPLDCCSSCDTPTTVSVPGTTGASAISLTTAAGVVPAVGANVVLNVTTTGWMTAGQNVFVAGANFLIASFNSGAGTVTLTNLGFPGDVAVGTAIANGSIVVPGVGNVDLLSGVTVLTDNSTGTAGDTIAAGVGVVKLFFPHTFIGGTAAAEPVTAHVLGFKFKILSWVFVTEVLLVGASGSRVANMEINATDVGTVASTITIPIANAAVGTITSGTAVSGTNTGTVTDTFSIELQAGGTAFTAGSGTFVITVQNMDDADAIASIAAKVNSLIAATLT